MSKLDYNHQESWSFISGEMQSPIHIKTENLIPVDCRNDNTLSLIIDEDIDQVLDNGHSLEVKAHGEAKINGRYFKLLQFHFHTPSEHLIDEEQYPIEIHFVTESSDGRLAVIAVMGVLGEENPALTQMFADLENHVTCRNEAVHALLPKEMNRYYHYLGSLTIPPLTENVEWYILKETVSLSKLQLEKFESYYQGNNRDIQCLCHRVVEVKD